MNKNTFLKLSVSFFVVAATAVLATWSVQAYDPDSDECVTLHTCVRVLRESAATPAVNQAGSDTQAKNINAPASNTSANANTDTSVQQSGGTDAVVPWSVIFYPIQKGDTLESVAKAYGVSTQSILNKNSSSCDLAQVSCFSKTAFIGVPIRVGDPNYASGPKFTSGGSENMDLRHAVFDGINQIRQQGGQPAVAWDDSLASAAQGRSLDMAARNYWSHYDPATGASLLTVRGCENISAKTGGFAASPVVSGWNNSPAHKFCILSAQANIGGVGLAKSDQGVWYTTLHLSSK